MEIGTKIKKIREYKNFTQEHMAEQLGISQSTYSRFEKDDSDLTISQIHQIAELLDVKVEDLINVKEQLVINNYESTITHQAHLINVISEKERELYEKTIKLLEDKIKYLEGK